MITLSSHCTGGDDDIWHRGESDYSSLRQGASPVGGGVAGNGQQERMCVRESVCCAAHPSVYELAVPA